MNDDDDDEPNSQPSETMSKDTNIGFFPSWKWLARSAVVFVDTFPAFF
jgi:hypothetical protein